MSRPHPFFLALWTEKTLYFYHNTVWRLVLLFPEVLSGDYFLPCITKHFNLKEYTLRHETLPFIGYHP